jgi:hypothetical protein
VGRGAPIDVYFHRVRVHSNEPRALNGRHLDATDPNLSSAREDLEIVENTVNALLVKRTIKKEHASLSDEPE